MRKLEAIRVVRRWYRSWGKLAVDKVANADPSIVLASAARVVDAYNAKG